MYDLQILLPSSEQKTVEKVMDVVGEMTPEQKQSVLAFFRGVEFGKSLASQQPVGKV